jgi:hypothetical protein
VFSARTTNAKKIRICTIINSWIKGHTVRGEHDFKFGGISPQRLFRLNG